MKLRNIYNYTQTTNEDFEVLGIKIQNISLFSVYVGQDSIEENTLNHLFDLGNKVIIIGDMNSRHKNWNCEANNYNGIKLNKFMSNNLRYVLLAPDDPTYFPSNPNQNQSIIDLALIKNITKEHNDKIGAEY